MARLWEEMGEAVSDIRQKLVEEAMWGRSLGDNDAPLWSQSHEPEPSFGSATHIREMEPECEEAEQDVGLEP
jgi:hypothetical protein